MKKGLIAAGVVVAVVAVVMLASRGNDDEGYLVRAIFDSGGFVVNGEEVRVAGANVGSVEDVDVTLPGEVASYEDGHYVPYPGKAVIVLNIEDPGFQDFRTDASCLIRPQSLLGEKFIDCRPTLPRAPGSPIPPALEQVPDDQRGAGQYLLPVENNSTTVDPDLINNIQSLPYAQRFRIIFNELGAGLAGRGADIEEVVKRANPVLRDVDRIFRKLRDQRVQLAQLAADSDEVLRPLARDREHVAGFFSNSGAAAEASAEKGEQLQESFRKFPEFLREFRATMVSLKTFSDAAAPVFSDFDRATPAYTEATRLLAPFSRASTVSLKSLGVAGEASGPTFRAADPVVKKSRDLARSGVSPTNQLAKFLVSTKKTGGWNGLVDLIYNTNATINGFDEYGHFGRGAVRLTNCLDYYVPSAGQSGCIANFNGPAANDSSSISSADLYELMREELGEQAGGTTFDPDALGSFSPVPAPAPDLGQGEQLGAGPARVAPAAPRPQRALLDYLLGP
jgi:phospholipid/cholesterol/gamma-HCH transport system substrate-binding protein